MISSRTNTDWKAVITLLCCGILGAFQVGKIPPAMPALQNTFSTNIVMVGWILSTLNLVGALLGIFIGLLVDMATPRRLVLYGLGISALGSVLGALAPNASLLIITRIVEGIGFLALLASIPTLILRYSSHEDTGFVMGIWTTFLPTGVTISMIVAPFIIESFNWQALWLTIAILILIMLLSFPRLVPRIEVPHHPDKSRSVRLHSLLEIFKTPGPSILGLCFAGFSIQMMSFVGFIPLWLVEHRNYGLNTASLVGALVMAANIVGCLMGGKLLGRGIQAWKLLMITSVVMSVTSIVIYNDSIPDLLRLSSAFIFSWISGIIPVSLYDSVRKYTPRPELIGTANGWLAQFNNLGQLSGPPILAALVLAAGSWEIAPVMLISGSLVIFLCGYVMRYLLLAAKKNESNRPL